MIFRVRIRADDESSIGTIPNILDSNNFKTFWVRWTELNTMEFGVNGKEEPLLKFTDPEIDAINSVVFNSNDFKSEWQIADLRQYLSNSISLPEMESSSVYETRDKYLMFKVKILVSTMKPYFVLLLAHF